ncbi:Ubiquitin-protein ligase E3A [Eumeta japonica]|uniref:Ubiquitin-protein ligase E3A n=1 Tax=Eumeta variegata TaxID=151549 RepID=A0A4C1WBE9_EUMVA|nr:Ubiquitin-protein ligase E3A [Eumeta japonica]
MNSNSETDEASRGSEASSSNSNTTPNNTEEHSSTSLCTASGRNSPQNIMKRAAAKQLIERYFYQLLDGCGNSNCDNKYCASSGVARNLTPNEAAAEAIKLFYKDAKLCDSLPNKVPRTDTSTCDSSASTTCTTAHVKENEVKDKPSGESTSTVTSQEISLKSNTEPETSQKLSQKNERHNNGAPLTEERICQLCDEYFKNEDPKPLIRALGEAFTQPAILARCFQKKLSTESNMSESKPKESEAMCSSSDPDKDVDSKAEPGLDVQSCRRAFQYLSKVPSSCYSSGLVTALSTLGENLDLDLRITKKMSIDDVVNCMVIAFEVPDLSCSDYLEIALPALCHAAEYLPLKGQAKLARIWAHSCKESLRHILQTLQQSITLKVISTNYTRHFSVQDDENITMATKLMKIVYYANMLAGVMESNTLREEPVVIASQLDPLGDALDHLYPLSSIKNSKQAQPSDPLAIELEVNVLDSRKPFLPFEEFYNEPLSDTIEMDKDFANYKTEISNGKKFAFLKYPFVLTAATKSLGLYYENRIRMYSERRVSLLHAVVGAAPPMPFLRLKVRRSHIIDDALVELEMVAMERALDLKKQLVVEFEGEQGVDEGGVSKEFFQLIVEEIFNPDYGMFTQQQDSHTVWFNPTSFETEAQFTLIGIVLGLAIYNNVILAVNFPMVVYRKLMGKKGSFEDLADWNPMLYNGLKDMLEYKDDDIEEQYMQTFRICVQDVFGNPMFHDLKENGDNLFVNQDNKREFADLYADYLLNKSVECQFKAFRRGFVMVTDESPLGALFRPEEVETLVCGSKNFDFNELEKSTEYDGGYTAESQTIKDFWDIVHSLSLDDKRKLLQFTTGSDRVPVGGLSHLKLIIARNGPDSDRLPTAHTCFNVLLLPEYNSKDKLQDRLMKAISYSKVSSHCRYTLESRLVPRFKTFVRVLDQGGYSRPMWKLSHDTNFRCENSICEITEHVE